MQELGVSVNMVLRRIHGPMTDEIIGGCRKLHSEKLPDLYSSPNIIKMFKSRRMRWERYVAGRERSAYSVFGKKTRRTETTRKTLNINEITYLLTVLSPP
jgi:hypothetical protein